MRVLTALAFALTLTLAGCGPSGSGGKITVDQVLQAANAACGWVSDSDNTTIQALIATYPPATSYVVIGKAICDAFLTKAGGEPADERTVNGVLIKGHLPEKQ